MPLALQQWDQLRLGRVINIDYDNGTCDVRYFDRVAGERTEILLTHPYTGRGWGILTGIEVGSLVLVTEEKNGRVRIVAYLPQPKFYADDVSEFKDVLPSESPYRRPDEGEVILQSKPNSIVALNKMGDILLQTPEGNAIEIDREADLIFQQSSQRRTVCDGGTLDAGIVRRDVRSLEDRQLDIVFGGNSKLGLDFDQFTDTVGLDPQYPNVSTEGGKSESPSSELIPGLFDPSFPNPNDPVETNQIGRGSGANVSDMINPGLTEWRWTVFEFADGNPGFDDALLIDEAKRLGHVEPNMLVELITGTSVNEIGRQLRFDYAFGQADPKGHEGRAWLTNENDTSLSTDRQFDRNNSLRETSRQPQTNAISAPGHNSDSQWTVDTLPQSVTATAVQARIHTKGANNKGKQETVLASVLRNGSPEEITQALSNSFAGSLWELQIDKEGLTKLNIPAATDVDGLEPYRAGRSVLLNTEGDITASVGKQVATGEAGLPRLTSRSFLNRNDYPSYGRKDRSLTLDLEGNLETWIGADQNVNQSVIAQLDGSISMAVGAELEKGSQAESAYNAPITGASKASSRQGRSVTGSFDGNMELEVGSDPEGQQSLIISTTGGNALHAGQDRDGQSLQVVTSGGIDIQIQGPMQANEYALHIDATGVLHIRTTGNIQVETQQQCDIVAQQDINVTSSSNINLNAANSINMLAGNEIKMAASQLSAISTAGIGALTIGNNTIGAACGTMNINAPGGCNLLGSLGVAGKFLVQGVPGSVPMPIARVGDLVQVGPAIGQIISGSLDPSTGTPAALSI